MSESVKRRAVVKGKPMPEKPKRTKEEVRELILERITEATGGNEFACTLCKNNSWSLNYGYVNLVSSLAPLRVDPQGPTSRAFPLVLICCNICGNTHFLNLLTLGFKELSDLELPER